MIENGTLDDLYFEWLYGKFIGAVSNRNPARSYWGLAKHLYDTPFVIILRDDHNRAEDGRELRKVFIEDQEIEDVEVNWLQLDCSVLEMLIGLACRAAFEDGKEPGDWFWILITNLGLQPFNDRNYDQTAIGEVNAIVARLLDRTYEKDGAGGLFPCKHAREDQTQVNIWYQLQAYLLENLDEAS